MDFESVSDFSHKKTSPAWGGYASPYSDSYSYRLAMPDPQAHLVRPVNGWQVESGSVTSLETALKTALADPARLRQMGAVSYQIVAKEINLEAMVNVFLEAISTCQDLQ